METSTNQQTTNDDLQFDSVTQKVVTLLQSNPKGITDKSLSLELPLLTTAQKAIIINKLSTKGVIALFQTKDGLLYKWKDQSTKGADNEEKIVYSIIEGAANKGIWVKDIRNKSNLPPIQLNKILKSLETKKYIKVVKSVAATKKKIYMLYDLEPDRTVTGGAWYQDQDFESEFVDILNQQCYRYLEQKRDNVSADVSSMGPVYIKRASYASAEEVNDYISKIKISKVKLTVEDLEMILNTLIYDGKAEKSIETNGTIFYRAIKPLIDTPGLVKSTCGICPIRKNCCDFGDITPIKCQYLSEWLDS